MKKYLMLFLFAIISNIAVAEEGMYPLSEIHKLDLKAKGLEIEIADLYNPNGISLIDGICKVGGCSGSFVSPKGLILTNHHCAYGAIKDASTAEQDFLENGFYAQDLSEEVQAKGYTVRITESYHDVSQEILSVVNEKMSFLERTKAIEIKTKEIITQAEVENPDKRASVSEMFSGKTYVLFLYTYLKDVRLVYAPPRAIGNFGEETDNWIWPRHTGDFSIMRAYTAPDGTPADYSPENIPYTPKKVIKIAPEGVQEEDFVFILGYPGRTFRHRTSHFLDYEYNTRLPFVAELYEWQINALQKASANNRDIALKHLSKIKRRSNTLKNYRGKLLGIKRLKLIDRKKSEEKNILEYIYSNHQLNKEYGSIFSDIGKIYSDINESSERSLILNYLRRSSNLLSFAYTLYEASIEAQKDDVERETNYMNRNLDMTKKRMFLTLNDFYAPTDKILFKNLLERAADLPKQQRITVLDEITAKFDNIDEFVNYVYKNSQLAYKDFLSGLWYKTTKQIENMNDPIMQLAVALYPIYEQEKEIVKGRKGALDQIYSKLIDVKKKFLGSEFVPDANRTLRLTYGNIRGYSPRDAIFYSPITTLDGIVEKTSKAFPFDSPQKLINLHEQKNFGRYYNRKLGSVPVAVLYNMDTTGGNSGSAILNAKGELVGINFDRAYEATINDFAWSEDYSRSIGVDIRYVLWVLDIYSEAHNLLEEMEIF